MGRLPGCVFFVGVVGHHFAGPLPPPCPNEAQPPVWFVLPSLHSVPLVFSCACLLPLWDQFTPTTQLKKHCGRLCAPNDKPPYLCILIAPASRYIFHSFPIEETEADKAFMHVLEGIVMAVVTEGMGMIDEVCMVGCLVVLACVLVVGGGNCRAWEVVLLSFVTVSSHWYHSQAWLLLCPPLA